MADEDTQDEIRIDYYRDSMVDQVVDLFVAQYGRKRAEENRAFQAFYEAPFQASEGIRLVALDGDTVCGFQSYFYWPYVYRGQRLRTFQSGNSLVSPDYRGRQIFARLLNFLHQTDDRPPIDFLMGFPVEMSFGSFLRNDWANPMDLGWFVRPISPLSLLRPRDPAACEWRFDDRMEIDDAWHPEDQYSLAKDRPFLDWRTGFESATEPRFHFHHKEGSDTIAFALKPNRRGRAMELVVGDVVRTSPDPALLRAGLKQLVRATRGHSQVTMLTIALNDGSANDDLLRAVKRRGFFGIKNKIHFIVKPVDAEGPYLDPGAWQLFRADIDTW